MVLCDLIGGESLGRVGRKVVDKRWRRIVVVFGIVGHVIDRLFKNGSGLSRGHVQVDVVLSSERVVGRIGRDSFHASMLLVDVL